MCRIICCLLLICAAIEIRAQESQLGAEFRHEGEHLKESCAKFDLKSLGGCAQVLFTDHPLHIAVGSIAPQNGFGVGGAFVGHWTPNEDWRMSFNADAVGSANGSWRAGAYFKGVYTKIKPGTTTVQTYPVIHAYVQTISLNKLDFYGEGPNTVRTAQTSFGMTETITGASLIYPLGTPLKLSAFGEINGRFVSIRGNHNQKHPSIEQVYTEATAPGLSTQSAFAQFTEGIRMRPSVLGDHLRLNYMFSYQQFVAGNSHYSFQRFNLDLNHQIPLYKTTRTYLARDHNGPDDCSSGATSTDHACPSVTRNREGSINLRLLMRGAIVSAGRAVPFYFQPTLGGSDVNGSPGLVSYQDYRFRGNNLILLRANFEHSIYGPLGVTFGAEAGKVTQAKGDLGFTHLRHSYTAGLTLRAGGFPMVYLLFAWGGREGTHTIGTVDSSLLGGSARPSLY